MIYFGCKLIFICTYYCPKTVHLLVPRTMRKVGQLYRLSLSAVSHILNFSADLSKIRPALFFNTSFLLPSLPPHPIPHTLWEK